ncbi:MULTISPECIES: copper resistance protein B [unclassified Caballeronia]|uniref:copper resistance protein B n=1 Tax=unclassified Caballeronia TaxID=2646786 RepID=UPI001FD5510E|nr:MULTISPECIES: copper resistance protein B [unclassified Caballeronia]MDR5880515.1 copper resistance protein B [Caballeronia sp. LZ032]
MDGMPAVSDIGGHSAHGAGHDASPGSPARKSDMTGKADANDQTRGSKEMEHMIAPRGNSPGTGNGTSNESANADQGVSVDASAKRSPKGGPESGPNHIIPVEEPRIPMANPNQGIPMKGMDMADDDVYHQILVDQLEYVKAAGGQGWSWDGEAWLGGDINRLWLKSSGDRLYGKTDDARVEALISRAYSTYWNAQIGVRHDFGNGPSRDWAAIGVEGLAPWFFDVEATGYIGASGRTALRLKTSYNVLLSQRLFLTPEAEVNVYGRADPEREIGSGVSDIKLGLRLRYQIRREIAPYVGFVWGRRFGRTADFARRDAEPVSDKELVVGVTLWY